MDRYINFNCTLCNQETSAELLIVARKNRLNEKKLLISWNNPYVFNEGIVPLIPILAERFQIYIILSDFFMPRALIKLLETWKNEGEIVGYLITPHLDETLKLLLFLKSKKEILQSYNFNIYLSGSMMQVFDRFLLDLVLPKHCIRICFWLGTTYLMEKELLVGHLLEGNNTNISMPTPLITQSAGKTSNNTMYQKLIKLKKEKGVINVIQMILNRLIAIIRKKVISSFINKIDYYANRIIVPGILVGKIFRLDKYDQLTQLGTDKFDVAIFCDEIEARAHAVLYKNPNIFIAKHPAEGSCRCHKNKINKSAILSPLSGFVGANYISEENLFLFYRDLKTVLENTGATSVHLRLHPRETGTWPYQLRDYLYNKKIEAVIVKADRPVREIMCDYIGMAGFASNSMRDARAACNYAFIIGFVKVSKARYANPKFVYGKSEGIDWIEEDGTCNPDIFIRRSHVLSPRKSVMEILEEIQNGSRDNA